MYVQIILLPAEVLGYIFELTLARECDYSLYSSNQFRRFEEGSHNFLLVCRHWFDVASRNPRLWSFWGRSLQGWNTRCTRAGSVPVDLVLDGEIEDGPPGELDTALRDALKARATQDKIRQVHLMGDDRDLSSSILSCLTPDGEIVQARRIESIIFRVETIRGELSNFFARSRLPCLRYLEIYGSLQVPLWDHLLATQTTRLTALSLHFANGLFPPTTSQLIAVLAANPNLQDLALSKTLPDEIESTEVRVPLDRLKTIDLWGSFRSVFQLLGLLRLPATLDHTNLIMNDSTLDDVDETLVPYMQGLFGRDARFEAPLEVTTSTDRGYVKIVVRPLCSEEEEPGCECEPVVELQFSMAEAERLDRPELKRLADRLIKHVPLKHLEIFRTEHTLEVPEETFRSMPNLNCLLLEDVTLSDGFLQVNPNGPHAGNELFPSLNSLCLRNVVVKDGDWRPLMTYLERQCSNSRHFFYLDVVSGFDISKEDMEAIERLVGNFRYLIPVIPRDGSQGSSSRSATPTP